MWAEPAVVKPKPPEIVRASDESVSIFLDIIRFLAALYVFGCHVTGGRFSDFKWRTGHDAVIIFFVLSGYVIGLTTEQKDKKLRQYAIARFSRLYSVVLPALLLTFIADDIGMRFRSDLYITPHDYVFGRLLAAATFVDQIWLLNIGVLSNDAYWSLPYEFWFYILWGIWFYLDGNRRNFILALAILIIGPKMLLYLPIWLVGIVVYQFRNLAVGKWEARRGFFAAILMLPALCVLGLATRFDRTTLVDGGVVWKTIAFLPQGYSFSDYILAAIVAAAILLFPSTGFDLTSVRKPVRFLANRTFSLYLYHFPLLLLFTAVMPASLSQLQTTILVVMLTLLSCLALASVTELKKRRVAEFFDRLLPGKSMPPETALWGKPPD